MKCKNKKSAGSNHINMMTVRKVIMGIAKPLSNICKFIHSFQSGKFQQEMKTTNLSSYKSGKKPIHKLQTYLHTASILKNGKKHR